MQVELVGIPERKTGGRPKKYAAIVHAIGEAPEGKGVHVTAGRNVLSAIAAAAKAELGKRIGMSFTKYGAVIYVKHEVKK